MSSDDSPAGKRAKASRRLDSAFAEVRKEAPALNEDQDAAATAEGEPQELEDKWWCYACKGVVKPACADQHPAALLDPATAEARLGARLRGAQRALAKLQDARQKRGSQLELVYEGCEFSGYGIEDGALTIALLNASPLPDDLSKQICDGIKGVEFSWDKQERTLTGACGLPEEAVAKWFPLRPAVVELKPGAVLSGGRHIDIYTSRCSADWGAGSRLLGYVLDVDALEVNDCDCTENTRGYCYICDRCDISLTVREATLSNQRAKKRSR